MTDNALVWRPAEDGCGTATTAALSQTPANRYRSPAFQARLRRRYRSEAWFRILGALSIGFAALVLVVLLGSIVARGYTAFIQAQVRLEVAFDPQVIDPTGGRDPVVLSQANYLQLVRRALYAQFPDVQGRTDQRQLNDLVSVGAAYIVRDLVLRHPDLIGTTTAVWLPTSDDVDQFLKGAIPCGATLAERQAGAACPVAEVERRISDRQVGWIDALTKRGLLEQTFNTILFTAGDSREPELAGIWGSVVGSFLTMIICLVLSVPTGVAAAVYLEEFAPKTRFTDLIEVNINNLAAVPSIVFGLLGLSVFLNVFGLPRSAPVVGGIVLALMTLPVVIIAGRSALKAVPPSIREAALGVGASPHQVMLHHVLPLAAPGILTGTIIGMARALGETAPLLMIGMVAFIVDIPGSFTDSATVMPVQIYMWSDSPERAFTERVSAAILILLGFLVVMNGTAIYLRKKFERRW